jgi:peptidoglycan/xylan/chitin deacetylase (PgdA/CDA1 family)
MTALARAGWRTLTLAEFAASSSPFLFPITRLSSPTRTFLLTFDDGYASLADHAYPVLADVGFTATTFLITDFVGRMNTWDVRYTWKRLPHLDWPDIEHWKARGFDFGSHSATHRRLTWLRTATVTEELERSRRDLVQRLGPDAGRAVAYPFGAQSPRVTEAARQAGYELGFGGAREDGADPLRLPRIPVYLWDAGSVPLGLRTGPLGSLGRFVAHVANRCAVGTSAALAVSGRSRPAGR